MGKRKRKRDPKKEAERRVKRQRANPRKRGRSRKERIGRSKMRQGVRQAVQTDIPYMNLSRAGKPGENAVYDLAAVKSKGITVVSWDGT